MCAHMQVRAHAPACHKHLQNEMTGAHPDSQFVDFGGIPLPPMPIHGKEAYSDLAAMISYMIGVKGGLNAAHITVILFDSQRDIRPQRCTRCIIHSRMYYSTAENDSFKLALYTTMNISECPPLRSARKTLAS